MLVVACGLIMMAGLLVGLGAVQLAGEPGHRKSTSNPSFGDAWLKTQEAVVWTCARR